MKTLIVDIDVVSFIFKQDTRATLYEPYILNTFPAISFMTLAELEKWAISANWGREKYNDLQETWIVTQSSFLTAHSAGRGPKLRDKCVAADEALLLPMPGLRRWRCSTESPLISHNRAHFAAVQGLTLISEAP